MTRTALVTVVCLMAFVPGARAQQPLRTTLGGQPGERLGWSLANYDDVDGDGVREYVAFHTRGARLYRGSDGAELGDYQRAEGLIGDIDGDGRSDFYSFDFDGFSGVLLPVDVLSGANGAVLASYPWEYGGNASWNQPSPLDDINGDGVGDFLRSESDFSTGPFLERVTVVPSSLERGLFARYHLVTDVTYRPDGILLLEQVDVQIVEHGIQDKDSGRKLRRVEFGRLLRVERDSLFSSNEPLWDRVVGQD